MDCRPDCRRVRDCCSPSSCFFFNDTATPEIYTLSLHDALPILGVGGPDREVDPRNALHLDQVRPQPLVDRKSTRLNSSHVRISYAVFCLKKKNDAPYQ